MNDELEEARLREDRVGVLLRRAGVVEQPPPPHVWEAVVEGVRAESEVTRLRPRSQTSAPPSAARPSRWPLLLAAAAVGALVTWAGVELADRPDSGLVLASGSLAPLVPSAPAGSAEVVEVDGQQRLRVTLDEAPEPGEGYLEVWLLRPDVSGLVTLGVLEGTSGDFLLPPGLDLGEYPLVDISVERVDGDPGHGGDSLVRGEVG
ncbi:anti-sigma factor [Ornithinimicrobium tianjinense]|uniref:Anti-sigma K factor RskA C-terminal domain-containing protein n=1 Tax=Ornithinimicrobium tianjinense TaxID=1195761 RepID=A0A917BPB9_9MICO|nr:anti-sigma factor [Ornithinimicrobium tianjinense]GGF53817.1 hypothetical protein GCM10011366_22070 [Ornithinimicrobium tianjinense]